MSEIVADRATRYAAIMAAYHNLPYEERMIVTRAAERLSAKCRISELLALEVLAQVGMLINRVEKKRRFK